MKTLILIDLDELKTFFLNLVDASDVFVEEDCIVEYWDGVVMHKVDFIKEPKAYPQEIEDYIDTLAEKISLVSPNLGAYEPK